MKTYAGGQGYVYQYYFVGKRAALADAPEAPASEYIFDVTSDRKTTFAVTSSCLKNLCNLGNCAGRKLTDAEQYGAVKQSYFRRSMKSRTCRPDGRAEPASFRAALKRADERRARALRTAGGTPALLGPALPGALLTLLPWLRCRL
jgi:hypothetical protein